MATAPEILLSAEERSTLSVWARGRSFPLRLVQRARIIIPEYLLNRLKEKANEINIPYQTLIKEYIKAGLFPRGR